MTSDSTATVGMRYAAGCDTGAVRDSNEDAVHASDRVLAVADGMRGPGGAAASAAAIEVLKPLDLANTPVTGLVSAVTEADQKVRAAATEDEQPITTLTALLRSGSQLALVHVGDSRAYLLRGGELIRLTNDHTWVQALVDQGKLSNDDSAVHPQRALLVRALGAGRHEIEADLALRTALPGDRYLLCSDGLSTVLDRATLRDALAAAVEPEQTVEQLILLAHAAGAPDNIACVIADIVPMQEGASVSLHDGAA